MQPLRERKLGAQFKIQANVKRIPEKCFIKCYLSDNKLQEDSIVRSLCASKNNYFSTSSPANAKQN